MRGMSVMSFIVPGLKRSDELIGVKNVRGLARTIVLLRANHV